MRSEQALESPMDPDTTDSFKLMERYLPGKHHNYRAVPDRLEASIRSDLGGSQDQVNDLPIASLCSRCSAIFNTDHADSWFEKSNQHHVSRADVDAAVDQGCQICSMIKTALSIDRPEWVSSQGKRLDRNQISGISSRIEIEGWTGDRLLFDLDGRQILDLQMLHLNDTDVRLTRDSLPQTTKSKQCLDLARHWLSTCRKKHYKCGDIPAGRTRCPTRLIEVAISAGTVTARLWCSDDHPEALPAYLTLSHCWGELEIFKLTMDRIPELRNSIDIHRLPQVFQDALHVTIELGYEYLWIDSLCICQDSIDDWTRESSTMDTVYREADCNIAATGFSDGQNGLFVQRDWNAMIPRKVFTQWTGTWYNGGQPRLQCYFIADDQMWQAGVDNAPLNKRCWVLQERLLSPCTLHFGNRQLFWECSEATCCELYPTGFPKDLYASSVKLSFDHLSSSRRFPEQDPRASYYPEQYRRYAVYRMWQKAVEAYTKGKLTCHTDRRLAITGAANRFTTLLSDEYLAGLWRNNLLRGLLWSVTFDSTVRLQPALMAPSWSWLSLDAAVIFITGTFSENSSDIEHSVVLEAHVNTINYSQIGSPSGGLLKIKGPLGVLVPHQLGHYSSRWAIDGQKVDVNIVFDVCGNDARPSRLHAEPLIKGDDTGQYSVSMGEQYAALLLARRPLFVLPLMTDEDLETGEPYMKGLLLGYCDGVRGQYIRLGIWTAETEAAKSLLLQEHEKLSSNLFLDFDGACLYTINII